MSYDAVVFDLYGTLVDFGPDRAYAEAHARMSELLGIESKEFRRRWLDTIRDRSIGKFGGLEDTILHICKEMGASPSRELLRQAADIRLTMIKRFLLPREGVPETMASLKDLGLKVGLITDCSAETETAWPETPMAPLVDVPLFSCSEGVCKPDPRIFLSSCERLGTTPDRCLYVGDGGSQELTGAKAVGMYPVLIRVEYDEFMDSYRPDALAWEGPRISSIPEVLHLVAPAQV